MKMKSDKSKGVAKQGGWKGKPKKPAGSFKGGKKSLPMKGTAD